MFLGPGTEFNRESQMLRTGLMELLFEKELFAPVNMGHLSEVMVWVAGTL